MKKDFAEPEMEVVRFNAQEIVTATSGCPSNGSIPIGPSIGCQSAADAMIIG